MAISDQQELIKKLLGIRTHITEQMYIFLRPDVMVQIRDNNHTQRVTDEELKGKPLWGETFFGYPVFQMDDQKGDCWITHNKEIATAYLNGHITEPTMEELATLRNPE